ncbi:MAG: helix-turn-helix domain-containing protein [Planctomycetaceae bacterium]|jgi:excisionase family DNA binding protein|nr:helix-turn-helix domain-containing protein [Planctomycetaceae bacterium]
MAFDTEFLTVLEVAARLKKSKQTIYRWMDAGYNGVILKSARLAGSRVIRPDDLDAFLASVYQEDYVAESNRQINNDRYDAAMKYLMSFRSKKKQAEK